MKGEIKFIKKQIFGGFSREDTVSYVAMIAAQRNEEREANIKANEEISALNAEIERLKLEIDERKSSISKLEDHIAQSIIIKLVADKDTAIDKNSAEAAKTQSTDSDIIGDEIPEFEYDPDWHKKYQDEANRKVALKLQKKEAAPLKAKVKRINNS